MGHGIVTFDKSGRRVYSDVWVAKNCFSECFPIPEVDELFIALHLMYDILKKYTKNESIPNHFI